MKRTTKCILIILFIIVNLQFFILSSVDDDNEDCIKLVDCPEAVYLTKFRNNATSIRILRDAHCGIEENEAKVHCKKIPQIPNISEVNTRAITNCVIIEECIEAKYLMENKRFDPDVLKLFQEAHCGYNGRQAKTDCLKIMKFVKELPINMNRTHLLPRIENNECGIEYGELRIYGGHISDIYEFPWLALLKYKSNTGIYSYGCHGSLISKNYVVSAAHCLGDYSVSLLGNLHRVILGEHNLDSNPDCVEKPPKKFFCNLPVQEIPVDKIFNHHSFDGLNYDIALIRLKESAILTDFVQPICLLPLTTLKENDELHISGWGKTETAKSSRIKLKAALRYTSTTTCKSRQGPAFRHINICAGLGDGIDTCKGDSGGPLSVKRYIDGDTFNFLVGVVSRGPKCGTSGAIYTRVSTFVNWILDNMEE